MINSKDKEIEIKERYSSCIRWCEQGMWFSAYGNAKKCKLADTNYGLYILIEACAEVFGNCGPLGSHMGTILEIAFEQFGIEIQCNR